MYLYLFIFSVDSRTHTNITIAYVKNRVYLLVHMYVTGTNWGGRLIYIFDPYEQSIKPCPSACLPLCENLL